MKTAEGSGMRLWHYKLIPYLDDNRLLGQHRECCALRGLGWGKKHSTVDYVFLYSPYMLFNYHAKVMREMVNRGMKVEPKWLWHWYRGKNCQPYSLWAYKLEAIDYEEHNQEYLKECLDNLREKGALRESPKYLRIGNGKCFSREL